MPDEPLGYYIFNDALRAWLGDDEKRFTSDFHEAQEFADFETADGIMQREQANNPDATLYVMACMPSRG